MTLELHIPPEQETLLRRQATAAGMEIAEYVMAAVQEKIATAPDAEQTLSTREWRARLEAIGRRHKPTGRPLDDSRDSIYPDRT
jgi:hypothetical protein